MLKEIEQKKKFAYALLKNPDKPFEVAQELLNDPLNPKNVGIALRISQLWVRDPVVIAEKERLLNENGAKHFLPSREELARELINVARNAKDFDTKHKFYRLYADTQGMIEKPTTNVTANIQNIANRVMVIKETANDDQWEKNLLRQQEKLVSESKSGN